MDAEWEEALAHITANPELASKKKNDGSYLIHAVLLQSYPPPVELVAALLRANPNAAALPHKGLLPLHLALDSVAAPEVVRALLEAHPHGAQQEITHQPRLKGMLPLHVAISTGTRNEVSDANILCILDAFPEAASRRFPAPLGFLPLHAVAHLADSVLAALLEAHPRSATERELCDERLPLHLAAQGASPRLSQIQDFDRVEVLSSKVEILLTAYPQAALEKDKHGMLPLHCAVCGSAPVEAVMLLLRSHSSGAAEKDGCGCVPLHYAGSASRDVVTALLGAFPQGISERDDEGCLSLHRAVKGRTAPTDAVLALLEAHRAAVAEPAADGSLPLHLAARCMPVEIVQALMAVDMSSLMVKNHRGSLPLHCAALPHNKASFMALLDGDSRAAAEKDIDGNLPLHLCLQGLRDTQVVDALLRAHPDGVAEANSD